jgi:shikimate kinase
VAIQDAEQQKREERAADLCNTENHQAEPCNAISFTCTAVKFLAYLPGMKQPGSFFLVGPMGAGKSTIGRQLARSLHLRFLDSDREIESRTGVDIPLIFELEGESGFRKREREIIDELTSKSGIVLATGGGAVLDAENRRRLASRGYVIYLHASVEQQLKRVAHDKNRPLLQTTDPQQKLLELMKFRDPLYREVADWIIQTDGCRVREVAQSIVRHVEETRAAFYPHTHEHNTSG